MSGLSTGSPISFLRRSREKEWQVIGKMVVLSEINLLANLPTLGMLSGSSKLPRMKDLRMGGACARGDILHAIPTARLRPNLA